MEWWILFCVVLTSVGYSHQSCKISADCDDVNLQWLGLSRAYGERGSLCSKGGLKGTEHGNLVSDDWGPTRQFVSHAITWNGANNYCLGKGRRLCRGDEICVHDGANRRMIDEVLRGDHWTPILDGDNKWLEIGDSRRFTCYNHAETHGGRLATWGNSFSTAHYRGYVYCCGKKYSGKRYRYIGKKATYDTARSHCTNLGKRLCNAAEICVKNRPVNGVISRDTWVPVNDRRNGWIQIGNARTCSLENTPSWGLRTDGTERDSLGFVMCC